MEKLNWSTLHIFTITSFILLFQNCAAPLDVEMQPPTVSSSSQLPAVLEFSYSPENQYTVTTGTSINIHFSVMATNPYDVSWSLRNDDSSYTELSTDSILNFLAQEVAKTDSYLLKITDTVTNSSINTTFFITTTSPDIVDPTPPFDLQGIDEGIYYETLTTATGSLPLREPAGLENQLLPQIVTDETNHKIVYLTIPQTSHSNIYTAPPVYYVVAIPASVSSYFIQGTYKFNLRDLDQIESISIENPEIFDYHTENGILSQVSDSNSDGVYEYNTCNSSAVGDVCVSRTLNIVHPEDIATAEDSQPTNHQFQYYKNYRFAYDFDSSYIYSTNAMTGLFGSDPDIIYGSCGWLCFLTNPEKFISLSSETSLKQIMPFYKLGNDALENKSRAYSSPYLIGQSTLPSETKHLNNGATSLNISGTNIIYFNTTLTMRHKANADSGLTADQVAYVLRDIDPENYYKDLKLKIIYK
ncbi:MAG: hypothetical protein HOO06_01990 [Bdellovibrionaceae bacterium]|jgi:hypothetical protein|nr:hypothetical protein [Pseudobdellovibrionaceae bacterium]